MASKRFAGNIFNEADLKFLEEAQKKTRELVEMNKQLAELKEKQAKADAARLKHADALASQKEREAEIEALSVNYKTEIDKLEKSISKNKKYDLQLSEDQLQTYINYGKEKLKQRQDEERNAEVARIIEKSSVDKKSTSFSVDSLLDKYKENRAGKILKSRQDQYNTILNNVIESKRQKGWSDEQIQSARSQEIIKGEAAKEFEKTLKESGKDFDAFGSILETVGSIFKSFISITGKLLEQGMNKQADAYNETFTDIAVRNNVSRGTYYNNWRGARNYLFSNRLNDNVGVSEVQQMWGKMAQNGITIDMNTNSAQAIETAVENVVTGKIVPYLDTTSTGWEQLQTWQPSITKQVRGIGASAQEITGSSTVTNKYLQNMIDELSPVASLAENEIGKQYAQALGEYEKLRAEGYSDYAIGEMYRTAASVYSDPYAALRSGDIVKMTAVANGIGTNADLRDFSAVNSLSLDAMSFYANQVPEGNLATLYGGILPTSVSAQTMAEINSRNTSRADERRAGKEVADNIDTMADVMTENFKSNKYQTAETLQNVTLENFMTELAMGKGQLGNYFSLIETAIKGIGTLITAKIVGGGIGKGIEALAVGGEGLPSLLGTAGPAVGALGAVGATLLGIQKTVEHIRANANDELNEKEKKLVQAYLDEGMSEDEAYARARSEIAAQKAEQNTGISSNPVGHKLMKYATQIPGLSDVVGMTSSYIFEGADPKDVAMYQDIDINGLSDAEKAKYRIPGGMIESNYKIAQALDNSRKSWDWDSYNELKLRLFMAKYGQNKRDMEIMQVAMALNALYNNKNNNSPIANAIAEELQVKDLSESGIQKLIAAYKITSKKDIQNMLSNADKFNIYLNGGGSSGEDWMLLNNISDDYYAKFNLYRTGLNEVPYDNFPALLHEGEAVLTADTANQLRVMIDEYRETRNQMQNIDIIIENQTEALVLKMDDILTYLKSRGGGMLPDSESQIRGKERLKWSMLHQISTKSMQS